MLTDLEARWRDARTSQAGLRLAEHLHQVGDDRRAERILNEVEEGLAAEPRNLSARVALGGLRLALGQAGPAARVLEQVVEHDSTHLKANKLLVEVYMELGERQRARDRLDLYRLLNEGDPEIEALEGLLVGVEAPGAAPPPRGNGRQRRLEVPVENPFAALTAPPAPAAAAAADTVFELAPVAAPAEPAEAEPTATLGDLYRAQGHREEAERIYRQVLEREPDNRRARRGLDELLAPAAPPAEPATTPAPPAAPQPTYELETADQSESGVVAGPLPEPEPRPAEPPQPPAEAAPVAPSPEAPDATPGADPRQRRIAALRGYLERIQRARGAVRR